MPRNYAQHCLTLILNGISHCWGHAILFSTTLDTCDLPDFIEFNSFCMLAHNYLCTSCCMYASAWVRADNVCTRERQVTLTAHGGSVWWISPQHRRRRKQRRACVAQGPRWKYTWFVHEFPVSQFLQTWLPDTPHQLVWPNSLLLVRLESPHQLVRWDSPHQLFCWLRTKAPVNSWTDLVRSFVKRQRSAWGSCSTHPWSPGASRRTPAGGRASASSPQSAWRAAPNARCSDTCRRGPGPTASPVRPSESSPAKTKDPQKKEGTAIHVFTETNIPLVSTYLLMRDHFARNLATRHHPQVNLTVHPGQKFIPPVLALVLQLGLCVLKNIHHVTAHESGNHFLIWEQNECFWSGHILLPPGDATVNFKKKISLEKNLPLLMKKFDA